MRSAVLRWARAPGRRVGNVPKPPRLRRSADLYREAGLLYEEARCRDASGAVERLADGVPGVVPSSALRSEAT